MAQAQRDVGVGQPDAQRQGVVVRTRRHIEHLAAGLGHAVAGE